MHAVPPTTHAPGAAPDPVRTGSPVAAVEFEAVIGLEIHAQLLTATKIFCGCSASFGAPPNTHVCPVCLGFPGALPVLNRRAVDMAIRAALALGCAIQPVSVFARKNYFYPDLPKGYQISQYEQPLATGGRVGLTAAPDGAGVGITRVHLEEDAGKSLHEGLPDSHRWTHVDFNRAGVPLVEIVTDPDLRSPADAARFYERLRAILVAIGVNDGNMEEGSLRCDANVSVRPAGTTALGVKAEVKNLNSFRFLEKALEYEIARQVAVVTGGGRVVQETRLWDAAASRTVTMRSKEEAHDYRYFPEPDLPPLRVDPVWVDDVRRAMPELPDARRARLASEFGLPAYDAAWLTGSTAVADYFETVARASGNPKAASNWIMGELARLMKERGESIGTIRVAPLQLASLIRLIARGTISGTIAKRVFEQMIASGEDPEAIVQRDGLRQIGDEGRLAAIVADVLAAQGDAVAQYRAGRTAALGFLVGQVMRATKGQADPPLVHDLLRKALDS
jgi:aspartyl-tRNA(Asn)/glutamyl-tRNA(Gln) amidotransferase subunit B